MRSQMIYVAALIPDVAYRRKNINL